jgi:hypothetical protein
VRSLLTSILALIVSSFVGMLIAQVLAVETNGGQEWIAVFFVTVLVAAAVTVVYFIVQLASGTRRAAAATAVVLLAIFLFLAGGLAAFTIWSSNPETAAKDLPIIAGLILPGVAIILVQWLIVRWRAPRIAEQPPTPRFGRGGQLS